MTDKNQNEKKQIYEAVRLFLERIGEDPNREGLINTPDRVERMLPEILGGYQEDLSGIVNGAVFHEPSDGIVLVRDIEFYSLCEHHLLPFFGTAHVAYIPDGKVIGLSKIPRIVDMFSRRLQLQERLTRQIADALDTSIAPAGIAVYVEASHLCGIMRGVRKERARLVTSAFRGVFLSDVEKRRDFYTQIKKDEADD